MELRPSLVIFASGEHMRLDGQAPTSRTGWWARSLDGETFRAS